MRLDLKQIARCARKYPWPKPQRCRRCGHPKLWGHGFVSMVFADFLKALEMRRYRCPACRCIIRVRPAGYFKRLHTDAATIRAVLAQRLTTGHWPAGCVPARARHWLRALRRKVLAVMGVVDDSDLVDAFDQLAARGRVPVSRSI